MNNISFVLKEVSTKSYLVEARASGVFFFSDKSSASRFKTRSDAEIALSRVLMKGLELNHFMIGRGDTLRFKIVKLVKKSLKQI